jgi:flavin reductase (DIM6/NTAB) family NADH-FMN oxidoreductase RutF/rubredoxin
MNLETYFKITYGLYVVSTRMGNKLNGFISNTVFQVTADPAQLAIVCSKNNFTAEMISQSKIASISVLQKDCSSETMGTFGYKSGRDVDKFSGMHYKTGKTGAPVLLNDTIAWFECEVIQTFDVGTHYIFIAKVIDGEILNDALEPLTYAYYREVKKGKAPKNAPTYIDPEKLIKDTKALVQDRYKCSACGYMYDSEYGDTDHNIPAGTSFEDLPPDWCCPVCGVDKSFFEKE